MSTPNVSQPIDPESVRGSLSKADFPLATQREVTKAVDDVNAHYANMGRPQRLDTSVAEQTQGEVSAAVQAVADHYKNSGGPARFTPSPDDSIESEGR